MKNRFSPFDQLCDLAQLLKAWKSVAANRGAAGIDRISLSDYAQNLDVNLTALAARLREGRYYPLPVRTVEMRKDGGGVRKLGILSIEDRIVQRAAKDVLEPLFESSFLPCSYGFRPECSTALAVKQVLEYRASGDRFVLDADIKQCFDSIDRNRLMELFSARIRDKRFQALVRMWLDTGVILPQAASQIESLYDRVTNWVTESADGIANRLANGARTDDYGFAGDDYYDGDLIEPQQTEDQLRKQARKEALWRLGKEGASLALIYSGRARKLLTPTGLALTGAAVLAAAAAPTVARAINRYLNPDEARLFGIVQGGALSPLLANLYLHEFDVPMVKAGFRLVRYADDFVITCRDRAEARRAMDFAAARLADLRLQLNQQKTRIIRFEDGLEFLGYRFNQFQNSAKPISPKDTSPVVKVARTIKQQTPIALAEAQSKISPVVAGISQKAKQQFDQQTKRLRALFGKKKEGNNDDTA